VLQSSSATNCSFLAIGLSVTKALRQVVYPWFLVKLETSRNGGCDVTDGTGLSVAFVTAALLGQHALPSLANGVTSMPT
jgi:hypothetical protein